MCLCLHLSLHILVVLTTRLHTCGPSALPSTQIHILVVLTARLTTLLTPQDTPSMSYSLILLTPQDTPQDTHTTHSTRLILLTPQDTPSMSYSLITSCTYCSLTVLGRALGPEVCARRIRRALAACASASTSASSTFTAADSDASAPSTASVSPPPPPVSASSSTSRLDDWPFLKGLGAKSGKEVNNEDVTVR